MGRWRTHNNRCRPRYIYLDDDYVLHSRRLGIIWRDPLVDLENRIYKEQLELIDTTYGSKTDCNLGWAVTGSPDHIDIATKVYVEGRPVIRSVGYRKTGKIEHEWA